MRLPPGRVQRRRTGWSCSAKKLVRGSRRADVVAVRADRCFFYLTNDRTTPASRRSSSAANDRCDQENLVAQLKKRCDGVGDAGGRPGEQQGLHGDGRPWRGA